MTTKTTDETEPHYVGHRSRLRKRFLASDQASMCDYELLEMLLGIIQIRGDTKPIAKLLLKQFGSLAGVIGAETGQLQSVKGIGTMSIAMLKVIHEIVCRMLKEQVMNNPVIDTGERVVDYCRAAMSYLAREQNRILFLNSKNYLIYDELKYDGTVDYAHTYPREIITRALELRAKSIIMVHNHPSGDCVPSRRDLDVTKHIKDIATRMEINLHDHIIVTKTGYYSMRIAGLI
jgi:DNA repair protein RadC